MATTASQEIPGSTRKPILVLGLGNLLLRDEGVGVRVVERVREFALPGEVEVLDGGTGGLDLLDVIAERELVIVVDAFDAQREPGTVMRLLPDELGAANHTCVSVHDLGFLEVLAVARLMGIAPRRVVIFGVQPARLDCGLELSDAVAAQVPELVRAVLAEIDGAGPRKWRTGTGGGEAV